MSRRDAAYVAESGGRWRKAWSWQSDDWEDVVVDEPNLWRDDDRGDDDPEELARRRLYLSNPYLVRCPPGRWRVDIWVEPQPDSHRVDVFEARLRRSGRRLVEWDWNKLAQGEPDVPAGAVPCGYGDLNGSSFSFVRLREADRYLAEHLVSSDEKYRGLFSDRRGHSLNGLRTTTEWLGGAAVTIQAPGDLDYFVATRNRGLHDVELGWAIVFLT